MEVEDPFSVCGKVIVILQSQKILEQVFKHCRDSYIRHSLSYRECDDESPMSCVVPHSYGENLQFILVVTKN